MLLTSVRVRPWSCLCVFCSVGRVTTIEPSSRLTVMSGWSSRESWPLGPLIVTVRPSIVTSTPAGMAMGRRPIRDIVSVLPDEREDFAAELGLVGLRAGHDPLARADDDDAQPAEDARDVGLAGIDPEAGLADPLQPGHDRHLAVDVLEGQVEDERRTVLLLADVGDEALVLEDAGDLALRARRRDDDLGVARPGGVPHAGQHVGNRIGDVHLDSYQLDFVTPGSSPSRARSRKQMRHRANRRMYARERPHTKQRWYACTLCLGVRPALAIIDFLAMCLPPRAYEAKGMPRSSRSFLDSSSVFAVVTMLISSPRRRSTLS